jgi:TDG/mug DNA glycosylase family protein
LTPGSPKPPSGSVSAVPDVLAPGLEAIFCGINPGRVSAAARAHFANPRNDFWRLLQDAGFTDRQLEPSAQFELVRYGYGLTNAAYRTTRGSGDLRSADFAGAADRLERLARELGPRAIAFVGKEAYRGTFGERPELGLQTRRLARVMLYVLPSTSPANAAVPYDERLRWFRAFHGILEQIREPRAAARAVVLDPADRVLLVRFQHQRTGASWWATPGGGLAPGETHEAGALRELAEEVGLRGVALGPCVWETENVYEWDRRIVRQPERYFLVRAPAFEVEPELAPELLAAEGVHEHRWWSLDELEASSEVFAPPRLPALLRELVEHGPPERPIEVSG